MDAERSARGNEHPFLRLPLLTITLAFYLLLWACLAGLWYWLGWDPWDAVAATSGWLVVMLLIRLPPLRRRINRYYAKRNGLEPPDVS